MKHELDAKDIKDLPFDVKFEHENGDYIIRITNNESGYSIGDCLKILLMREIYDTLGFRMYG